MSRYLDFEDKKYQGDYTQVDPSKLGEHIGKRLVYLTDHDIDKSGRGYIFPKSNIIKMVIRTRVIFENMDEVRMKAIIECGVK